MKTSDESVDVIKRLAGAAQAGARGDIALAALEVMEAVEAVQASRLYVQNPGMLESALSGLVESGRIRITAMMDQSGFVEQAARDLVLGNGRYYEC